MKRIVIIGCGGAGKSTLARQLGEKLKLPVVHLDRLFWRPGWVQVSQEEFDALHRAELSKDRWIIDGNFNRTIPERLQRCDTVIYLDFSRFACLFGVMKRLVTHIGKVRPDMGEGCPEKIDPEFLKWIWNFNKNKREVYYRMLKDTAHAKVIILKNRREAEQFLRGL